jgi:hypothetical protein
MTRREFFPACVVFCLSGAKSVAGGLPRGSGTSLQDQDERPEFFASRVSYQQDVINPDDVLGEPDERFAEIRPGGQMIIFMEDRIYPSMASDDGRVICRGDARYGLAGWFPVGDSQDPQQYAWMPLVDGKSPSGFRLSAFRPDTGSPGVNMLKIINNDSRSLFIDAFVGYGHEPEQSH